MVTKSELKKQFKLVEVTVEDVYKAIEKNGFEHIRESWIETDANGNQKACVLGQGALNLNVVHTGMEFDLSDTPLDEVYSKIYDEDENEGDKFYETANELAIKHSLEAQLNKFKVNKKNPWYQLNPDKESLNAGDTIVHWNDAHAEDSTSGHWKTINGRSEWVPPEYLLKTYGEVTKMAYDVLSPHFEKKVKLLSYDFDYQMPTVGSIPA